MRIGKVIVDVQAASINQTFDYLIPTQFLDVIQRGMRVIIPFGPRKISGFVVDIVDDSEVSGLKEIIDVLDLTPVLTEELLEVGKWLASETMCFYITALQAMLPQLLKASYKKEIIRQTENPLPQALEKLFLNTTVISYESISERGISYSILQKYIQTGDIVINYVVKSKETKRYKTLVKPVSKMEVLKEEKRKLPSQAIRQKQILDHFINDPKEIEQSSLLNLLGVSRQSLISLVNKQILETKRIEVYRNPYEGRTFSRTSKLPLTDEQALALSPIKSCIQRKMHDVFLVHGVTGSGKTEIYLQAIEDVLKKGQEAIVLVPEISLTPQMVKRFKGRFGSSVAVLHSALSHGEKYDEWRKIHRKEVQVVVGARSAIFAPFTNIGIIIIDEEHETTYKQEDQPRYHARDVAIHRGKTHECPVVLGSATPTLESYARARKGVYQLSTLRKRTNKQEMPEVEIVDMREELHAGNRTMFSRILIEKIEDRLSKNEQIVLLLNRRGYSTFVMCRECGHVKECPHCDIALTYHKQTNLLKCHYCSREEPMPTSCPECASNLIRYFGTGTQRVEESLKEILPTTNIIRMDVDTTSRKGAHEKLLQKFSNQEANILLGTQMIAKGLDFPNVTLVGVLAADSMLHLPDFRAAEKTFQLITQVSGRAGRHTLPGEVLVQTYSPDHYSIEFASEYRYEDFYQKEMKLRKTFQYPPYVFLVLITVSHTNKISAIQATQKFVQMLMTYVSKETTILGPTPSPLSRIKNRYRYQCMIKYKHEPQLRKILNGIMEQFKEDRQKKDLQIVIDMQPYQLM